MPDVKVSGDEVNDQNGPETDISDLRAENTVGGTGKKGGERAIETGASNGVLMVHGVKLWMNKEVDVIDTAGYWSEAEILKIFVDRREVLVTYTFFSDSWDEYIPFDEVPNRVADRHTYTYRGDGNFQIKQRIELRDYCCESNAKSSSSSSSSNSVTTSLSSSSSGAGWKEAFVVDISPQRVCVRVRNERRLEWINSSSDRLQRFGTSKTLSLKRSKRWTVPGGMNKRERQIASSTDAFGRYEAALSAKNLSIYEIPGDGNCLFRAVAHQVYGDDSLYALVREKCCDYMESERDFFSNFVVGGIDRFPDYIHAKRQNSCWGDDPEIQAVCELYNRPAEIWAFDPQSGAKKLRVFHGSEYSTTSSSGTSKSGPNNIPSPMRLSFYGGGHYDSIICEDFNRNLLQCVPGEAEDRAMAKVKLFWSSEKSETHTATAIQASDAQVTELATLEVALRNSRNDIAEWGNDDLQTCLALSLEDYDANDTCEVAGMDIVQAEAKNGELSSIQGELYKSVEEMSEREYIEQAVASSIIKESANNFDDIMDPRNFEDVGTNAIADYADMDAEVAQAIHLSNLSESEALELALQESLKQN